MIRFRWHQMKYRDLVVALVVLVTSACADSGRALEAADAGLPLDGHVDAAIPADVGDAGLIRGTYAWCQYASDSFCYLPQGSGCAQRHVPAFRTNGHCDCAPETIPGYFDDCMGLLGGPCRRDSPRCEHGLLCGYVDGSKTCVQDE